MSVGKFAFLPNLRSGAAAGAEIDGVRLAMAYDLEITGDGAPKLPRIPVSARLKGPGDVVGIDPAQITRIEPEAQNKGFEPNYFPFVELKDPDLPWRYTLATGTPGQLMPWITLIALKDEEFTTLNQGTALAPRIQVHSPAASLPDLGQAWATAHVQVDMNATSATPADVIEADPGRGFARLFACRKLDAAAFYTLFIVPTYAVGRQAALGEDVDPDLGATLSWDHEASEALTLPTFFRHRFRTVEGEDVETLLRKLRAIRADEADEAGAPLPVWAGNVGYYKNPIWEDFSFDAQAALSQPGYEPSGVDTPLVLRQKLAATLNTVLAETAGTDAAEPDETEEAEEDPLLVFPAHGAHYAEKTELRLSRAMTGQWFETTNIDLKYRAAAGLGRKIVTRNDEHFAQLCWDQYDEILAANQALMQLQVATILANRLEDRHFSRLDSQASLQLCEPLQDFVRTDPESDKSASVGALLQKKKLPGGFGGLSLRRNLSRKQTRVRAKTDKGPAPRRQIALAPLPGNSSAKSPERPEKDSALVRRREVLAARSESGALNAALGALFNPETLGRKPKPRQPEPLVGEYATDDLQRLFGDKLRRLPQQKADSLIGGRTGAEKATGGIIYRAPRIPEPLVDYLLRVSRDGVLSNAAALPDNTVSLYDENRAFIEAVMLGANHAMNEELRWREYPTDMRGTIFPRFWNRGALPGDRSKDDIMEIRSWTGKLGEQENPADADGSENLVVVIKGDVIRKIQDPIVEISIAHQAEWAPDAATPYPPVYFGKIGQDTVYYGFDISRDEVLSPDIKNRAYFAIYEPPARLRFGLDVGQAAIRATRPRNPDAVRALSAPKLESWDDLSWKHMRLGNAEYVDFTKTLTKPSTEPVNHWTASKTAAGLARSFWQKPLAALLPLKRVL